MRRSGRVARAVLAVALGVLLAGCGGDDGDDGDRGGEPSTGADGASTHETGPEQLIDVPVELAAGEAVRVSVNALGQVDLSGCLAVEEETVPDVELLGTFLACLDGFDGDVPPALVTLSSSSADEWDDVLDDDTARGDDANVSGESYYEIRMALVAPADGTYHVLAHSDDEVDAEVVVETASEPAEGDPPDELAGLIGGPELAAAFPQYEAFFAGWLLPSP